MQKYLTTKKKQMYNDAGDLCLFVYVALTTLLPQPYKRIAGNPGASCPASQHPQHPIIHCPSPCPSLCTHVITGVFTRRCICFLCEMFSLFISCLSSFPFYIFFLFFLAFFFVTLKWRSHSAYSSLNAFLPKGGVAFACFCQTTKRTEPDRNQFYHKFNHPKQFPPTRQLIHVSGLQLAFNRLVASLTPSWLLKPHH